jgi:acetylornithine/succinyldiaminopimelate/putrescine aminotransferase
VSIADDIRRLLATPVAEVREAHAAHINPTWLEALDLVGWGRDFVRADGLELTDADGRTYLDFLAGYGATSLGHNHPDVRAAIGEALGAGVPHFLLVSPQPLASALARKLGALAPGGLGLCTLAGSGSEAVEAALKLARLVTRRGRFVSAEGSYHGTTLGALSVTGSRKFRDAFAPLPAGAAFVPFGDADAIERELRRRDVAAVVLEPVQGEGGVRPAPAGYLAAVRRLCSKYGTLLVLDEAQTGLGRCGRMFACEEDGVAPDALVLAKGLSGGLAPVAAMLTRPELWKRAYGTLERYDLHCSTFAGGPIACAAALATLAVIERDGLAARAAELGARLGARLGEATAGHPLVRQVRGRGLLWGIELAVSEGVTADLVGQWLVVGLIERGVLTQVCGAATNVVRAQPPLTVTEAAIDHFGEAVRSTLAEHATGKLRSLVGAAARAARNRMLPSRANAPGEKRA